MNRFACESRVRYGRCVLFEKKKEGEMLTDEDVIYLAFYSFLRCAHACASTLPRLSTCQRGVAC